MRHFRFHLGTLVILILLLGVGFAALRESNEIWDSSIFSITLGLLLISILLAVHRAERKRAFWLGFTIFGSAYLVLSVFPSIEPRLITTKALHFLDSKVPRSSPKGHAYFDYDNDGLMDLFVVKNSEPNVLILHQGNGTWEHVIEDYGSNPADKQARSPWQRLLGTSLNGSNGTTEHFLRIGHSLLAVIVASLGGYISRHLYAKNREAVKESIVPERSTSSVRSGN